MEPTHSDNDISHSSGSNVICEDHQDCDSTLDAIKDLHPAYGGTIVDMDCCISATKSNGTPMNHGVTKASYDNNSDWVEQYQKEKELIVDIGKGKENAGLNPAMVGTIPDRMEKMFDPGNMGPLVPSNYRHSEGMVIPMCPDDHTKSTQWDPGIMKGYNLLVHSGQPLDTVGPIPSEMTQCIPLHAITHQGKVDVLIPNMTDNAQCNILSSMSIAHSMLTFGVCMNNQTGEATHPSLVEGGLHDLIFQKPNNEAVLASNADLIFQNPNDDAVPASDADLIFKNPNNEAVLASDADDGKFLDTDDGEPLDANDGEPLDAEEGKPLDADNVEPLDTEDGELFNNEDGELPNADISAGASTIAVWTDNSHIISHRSKTSNNILGPTKNVLHICMIKGLLHTMIG